MTERDHNYPFLACFLGCDFGRPDRDEADLIQRWTEADRRLRSFVSLSENQPAGKYWYQVYPVLADGEGNYCQLVYACNDSGPWALEAAYQDTGNDFARVVVLKLAANEIDEPESDWGLLGFELRNGEIAPIDQDLLAGFVGFLEKYNRLLGDENLRRAAAFSAI